MVVLFLLVVSVILSNRVYKITAYCDYGITKSGKVVRVGMCAADPRLIKLGSTVLIEGLGDFIVEDTGGKVKGRVIDIYMADCYKAKEFGVKWLRVNVKN